VFSCSKGTSYFTVSQHFASAASDCQWGGGLDQGSIGGCRLFVSCYVHGCERSGQTDIDSAYGCLASDMHAVKGMLPHVAVYCGPGGLHARDVHQYCIGQKPKL
jgi:hypothetical protein